MWTLQRRCVLGMKVVVAPQSIFTLVYIHAFLKYTVVGRNEHSVFSCFYCATAMCHAMCSSLVVASFLMGSTEQAIYLPPLRYLPQITKVERTENNCKVHFEFDHPQVCVRERCSRYRHAYRSYLHGYNHEWPRTGAKSVQRSKKRLMYTHVAVRYVGCKKEILLRPSLV